MSRDGELVELTRAANEPLAGLIVAALERGGIPSVVHGAFVGNLGLFGALGGVPKVMVRPDDLARARLVLDELEGRLPGSDDGDEGGAEHDEDEEPHGEDDEPHGEDDEPLSEDDDFGEEDELSRPQ